MQLRFTPTLESLDARINLSAAIPTGSVTFIVDGTTSVVRDTASHPDLYMNIWINPSEASTANGGVWKTRDGGISW